MAFRRKTIITNPNRDLRNPKTTKPIGVTMPFNNPSGVFFSSFTTIDQVNSNLKNLLMTARGERYFQPDFGTNIRAILFENIVDEEDFKERISTDIQSAISLWLPYLNIQSLVVNLNVTDRGEVSDPSHVIGITLTVNVSGTNIYLPIRIFISETATIRIEEAGV